MANKTSVRKPEEPAAARDARNEAGGRGLPAGAEARPGAARCHGLLQRHVLRAGRRAARRRCKTLIDQVDDNVFLAKLAVYSRERAYHEGHAGGLLLALSKRDPALFRKVFDRVVDNGRALRTLFQMVRSGQFGRKSLSYSLQRAFQRWLNAASVEQAAVGFDRQRSEPARRAAPGSADAGGQRPACAVRLADRQAGREVGTGHRGRSAGGGHGAGCFPQGGDGRGAGR